MMCKELAMAPITVSATAKPKNTTGTTQWNRPSRVPWAVTTKPKRPVTLEYELRDDEHDAKFGLIDPVTFKRVSVVADQSARMPVMKKPSSAPTNGSVYAYPVWNLSQRTGGSRKGAARLAPMKAVHPIMVPCVGAVHKNAGCANSGSGQNTSLRKVIVRLAAGEMC